MRRSISLAFCLALAPLLPARAAPNALCRDAGLASLAVSGLARAGIDGEVCERPAAEIPSAIAAIILRVGEIHREVARAIGQTFAETVGDGVRLTLFGHADGSIAGYTLKDGSRIMLALFPDADPRHWPQSTYAHELAHYLELQAGPYARSLRGFREHPFVSEGIPDLVALTSRNRTVVPFEDAGLPACLRISRDATPERTLAAPAGDFRIFAASRRMRACCETLTDAEKRGPAGPLCAKADPSAEEGFYRGMEALGADLVPLTPAERRAPFSPAQCLYRVRGREVLGACNPWEFAPPLASFFLSLRRELGRSMLPEWLALLRASPASVEDWSCRFAGAGESVPVALRAVAPSLRALRERLDPAARAKFDDVWRSHAFDRVAELDALFLRQKEIHALVPLSARNREYAGTHRCASPLTGDARACAVTCERVAAPNAAVGR